MSKHNSVETGVVLPEDAVITTEWAKNQLERVDIWSAELMAYGRGEVFFMLRTHLSEEGFKQSVVELGYTTETAERYITYLQKRPILEEIKAKYFVALSLSASEYIPDSLESALALMNVCIAKFGKPTSDNLRKASEATGTLPTRMSAAAITVEKDKKKALNDWLQSEHNLSDNDILEASRVKTEGKTEFIEKMIEAFDRLDDWKTVYNIIAKPIHDSGNTVALRFLSDINDASKSINSFLKSEKAHNELTALKQEFEDKVYPELNFAKEQ